MGLRGSRRSVALGTVCGTAHVTGSVPVRIRTPDVPGGWDEDPEAPRFLGFHPEFLDGSKVDNVAPGLLT